VYISEAHAIDEWPVGDGYGTLKGFKQPKTIEQRIAVAKEFVGDFTYGVPMVVDTMTNQFDNAFACWPVRYYILNKGHIYYKAQPNAEEYTYSVEELRSALAACVRQPTWAQDEEDLTETESPKEESKGCDSSGPAPASKSTASISSSLSSATSSVSIEIIERKEDAGPVSVPSV